MAVIKLEVDGKVTNFRKVWVHLKDECHLKSVPFRIIIPQSMFSTIFDPYKTKPKSQRKSDFIKSQVDSLGTFILEAYFKAMARICKNEDKCFEWVIARLDNVVENEEFIEMIGKAEPFATQFFE